jgi:hypothetical protein
MSTYTLTPEFQNVHNQLDSLGLLLGLPRVEEEKNVDYRQRLYDVFVHRANSTYLGLIYGITRELGLSLFEAIRIQPILAGDIPLGSNPVITFEETKCKIYSDISDEENGLVISLDRFDLNGGYYSFNELIDAINDTGYFTATLQSGVNGNTRSMQIYNQSTITLVNSETIAATDNIVTLANKKLIEGSILVSSSMVTDRVASQNLITKSYQYYIDKENGILYTGTVPESSATIRYKYRNDDYYAMASPIILHNLQSDDFKAKMFEQILLTDNTYANGAPTVLGAEIVNELLSVYGSYLGK